MSRTSAIRNSMRVGSRAAAAACLTAALLVTACDRLASPSHVTIPADSAAGDISFRFSPRAAAVIVSAYVNGKGPIDLILDTGSTLTCLDDSLTRELKLPRRLGAVGVGAGVGMSGPVKLLKMDSLRVGAAAATNITVCSLDLRTLENVSPGARGLLGLNFLKEFRVSLDFRRHILHLAAP